MKLVSWVAWSKSEVAFSHTELTPRGLSRCLSAGKSFLRLGDGELRFLLEVQSGLWRDERYDSYTRTPHADEARGTLGLRARDASRLLNAYKQCDILDTYGKQRFNCERLAELRLMRKVDGVTTSSDGVAPLLNRWTQLELHEFLCNRNVLICGGEAALLKELYRSLEYRELAAECLPTAAHLEFVTPVDSGRELSQHLDTQISQLRNRIIATSSDLLLVSLGGTAKIIAFELARDVGVCAVDFGSMLRALTYSGSDGQACWRASHNPFLFRVPLSVWYPALRAAHPGQKAGWYLAKTHAQILLELQKKERGHTHPSDVHDVRARDLSVGNLEHFQESYGFYRKFILAELPRSRAVTRLDRDLHGWLIRNKVPVRLPMWARVSTFCFRGLEKLRRKQSATASPL